jgi:hypothetical protein
MSATPDQSTGRVAVVTGASSGIGEATARALAAGGFRLALLARRADRIQALAGELGHGALAIQADVTDRDSLLVAADRVQAELGGADVLVNNAGIMLLGPFTPEAHDDHRRMIEANLLGAMTVTEVFLGQLRDGGGDLVNLSSVAGRTARPGNAVYAATKWPGTPARRPGHGHRTGCRGDRADRPHQPARRQAGGRADVQGTGHHRRRHRRGHRLRRHPAAPYDAQRDPRPADRPEMITGLIHRAARGPFQLS